MKRLLIILLIIMLPGLCGGRMIIMKVSSGADVTAPDFSSATIDGSTLVVTWTEACSQGASYNDSHFDLDGAGSGTDVAVTYQSGDGTAEWTFASGSAAVFGDSVNLDFDGTADSVEDAAGNDLAELTNEIVTNNTAAAGGAPEYSGDADTATTSNSGATLTLTHVLDSALSNGYIVAQFACYTSANTSLWTATFDSTAMTQIHHAVSGNDGDIETVVFGLAVGDKGSGSYSLILSCASSSEISGGAAAFNNVHQTTSIGTVASASGLSTAATCNVSSAEGELVVGWLNYYGGTMTEGAGQTEIWSVDGGMDSMGTYEDGAGTVTTSFSMSASHEWVVGGVGLKPLD